MAVKKTTYKGRVFKNATKVRARQIAKGNTGITMSQAKSKAREIVAKRKGMKDVVETAFSRLTGVGSGQSRPMQSDSRRVVSVAKPVVKTGPTAKTKTVRRIAERKGISRAEANQIRKARKS